MQIKDLNNKEIYALRNEICLNSLFVRDYENSFGIDAKEVCDFFNGYVDYLYEINELETDYFVEVIDMYDNYNNLVNYFMLIK